MDDDITFTGWRKSRYSKANGNCAEVAAVPGVVLIRDSKDPDGPVLAFRGSTWGAFLAGLRAGRWPGRA